MLLVIFMIGVFFTFFGPVSIRLFPAPARWDSPAFPSGSRLLPGCSSRSGMTTIGLLMVIGDYYLARFFYHVGIRYLKWNISVITGTESAA